MCNISLDKDGDKIKLSLKQSRLFALLFAQKISYDMNRKNNKSVNNSDAKLFLINTISISLTFPTSSIVKFTLIQLFHYLLFFICKLIAQSLQQLFHNHIHNLVIITREWLNKSSNEWVEI